jgi:hypothetical protein
MVTARAESLGGLRSRHNGSLLRGSGRVQGWESSRPWLVFEVHDRGVAIQPDPREAAKLRRYSNVVLEAVFRPIPFWLGMGTSYGPGTNSTWTVALDHIAEVSNPSRKCLVVETTHRVQKAFRFGSSAGFRDTVRKLSALGITCQWGEPQRR